MDTFQAMNAMQNPQGTMMQFNGKDLDMVAKQWGIQL